MDAISRRSRETKPKVLKPIRKVQVVCYLIRNGQLQHPHYMKVTHLLNQPLCLREAKECPLFTLGLAKGIKENLLVAGRIEQLQISNRVHHFQEPNLHTKEEKDFDEDEEKEDEDEFDEEKSCYTSSTTPRSRCSRGVSTDEIEDQQDHQKPVSDSVLLQLIVCGNLVVNKAKNVPIMKQPVVQNNLVVKKGENWHRGTLCKCAVKKKVVEDDEMINYMSENSRLGKLEAKEYFSGSIVESMNFEKREPVLKKSNSYNEESGRGGRAE
ncbi:hypothetical protein F3Y22_tig00110432pilonHSYRG00044 [Hibiscus syriacus]|uniref:SOSEKI DIX-like domain-containing protein n=1 Tax=Hibiscus syriacus TaxID=106335 RepID=A0A6A3AJY8_HIBSY|nr:hypothetical protein F3Y22_tig00110432pilonHSYRG00044 [Hibiscus syriacus]